ncbi:4-alpha-glucanotransferase, partial [Methylobacterium sp. B1]|uniref:4-alpha-glucanotransferase n=1 Tax=Methylobacterium sp. B1 TaxID=91459 RepID=UPI0005B7C655
MSPLEKLADLVGVAAGYTDAFGKPVETPLAVRRGLLAALGFAVQDEASIAGSLAEVERLRRGLIPPLLPVEARRAARVPVRLQDGAPHTLVWRLVDERGTAREGRANPQGSDPGFELPPLTPGYHRLIVQAGQSRTEAWVIAAPQRCWRPRPYTDEGASDWGLAAQLYGLRSATNIGIGTYADAGEAAREAALRGAAFLGLSPVHALFGSDRTKISPYSPSSRLFLETLFIAPRSLPGLAGSRAEALLDARADAITALREAALVDHQGVHDVLDPVLRALWADSPARAGTDADFARFRQAGGEDLESHALFEALSEHFRGQGAHWLGDWADAYRRAGTEAVRAFAA